MLRAVRPARRRTGSISQNDLACAAASRVMRPLALGGSNDPGWLDRSIGTTPLERDLDARQLTPLPRRMPPVAPATPAHFMPRDALSGTGRGSGGHDSDHGGKHKAFPSRLGVML